MSLVVKMAEDLKALDKKRVEQNVDDLVLVANVNAGQEITREALPLFAAAEELHARSRLRHQLGWLLLVATVCCMAFIAYRYLSPGYSGTGTQLAETPEPATGLSQQSLAEKEQVTAREKTGATNGELTAQVLQADETAVEERTVADTELLFTPSVTPKPLSLNEKLTRPEARLKDQAKVTGNTVDTAIDKKVLSGEHELTASTLQPVHAAKVPLTRTVDESLYQRASDLANTGLASAAIEQLDETLAATNLDVYPQSTSLYAALLLQSGQIDRAEELITHMRTQMPESREFARHHIRLLLSKGQYKQAQVLIDYFAAPVDQDPELIALQAAVHQGQQQWPEAAQSYRSLLRLYPSSGDYWIGLAVALDVLGDTANARAAYQRALSGSGGLNAELQRYAQGRLVSL